MRFDAFCEPVSAVLNELDRRVIHLRGVASLGQGDPDLPGKLCGQPVELKGREQAEEGLRRPHHHDGQAFVFRRGGLGESVEAAAGFCELAAGRKTSEVDPMNSKLSQITGAQQALLLGEQQEPLSVASPESNNAILELLARTLTETLQLRFPLNTLRLLSSSCLSRFHTSGNPSQPVSPLRRLGHSVERPWI